VIIGGVFLYTMLGVSALAGIACIPATAPIAYWNAKKIYGMCNIGRAYSECDKVWLRTRDARTSATKEFLTSIKPIKLNAWEPYFKRRIQLLRRTEIM
jgi:hypothetical protein